MAGTEREQSTTQALAQPGHRETAQLAHWSCHLMSWRCHGHIFTPAEDCQHRWAVAGRILSGTEISKACESERLPMFSQSSETHRTHSKCTQEPAEDPLRSVLGSLAWEQASSVGLWKVPLESQRGVTETDVRIHRIPKKQPHFRE